jgi:16S rRNA (cytosine1402-N4)-methyltransferase
MQSTHFSMETYHQPALLRETVDGLNIRPDGIYVDATFGGGGHAREILARLDGGGRLYGFDQDEDAEKNAPDGNAFVFVRSNFRYLENFMDWYGVAAIDGLLADLGVSWRHFDDAARGFSFRLDGDLDMRMNRQADKTAAEVLNTCPEETLADIFYRYGELRNARAIAKAVAAARATRKIKTAGDFMNILRPFFSRGKENRLAAQAFQALRIEVNDELDALKEMLWQAAGLLKPGGRLAVISYHSLEDRPVKNFFKTGDFEGAVKKDFYGNLIAPFRQVNSKVIVPGKDEAAQNPRSRSAKLRIAEKL